MNDIVQKRVMKILCEVLNLKEDNLRLDASIRDDLKLDSLKQMTLFIALEDEFNRTIPPEEVTSLVTVQDIIKFIQQKLEEPSPV